MIGLYLLCAVTGVSFMGFSFFFGHYGHGHAGSFGHHGHDGGVTLPYFSPMAIAAYLTGFGSAGLLLTQAFHVTNPLIHLPASLGFAASFGVGTLFGMAKIAQNVEGNALASFSDVVGTDVEVTIAIGPKTEGEVAYVAGGTRVNCIARAEAEQSFPQGARVRVTRAQSGLLYVTRTTSLPPSEAPVSVGEPLQSPPPRDKVK